MFTKKTSNGLITVDLTNNIRTTIGLMNLIIEESKKNGINVEHINPYEYVFQFEGNMVDVSENSLFYEDSSIIKSGTINLFRK